MELLILSQVAAFFFLVFLFLFLLLPFCVLLASGTLFSDDGGCLSLFLPLPFPPRRNSFPSFLSSSKSESQEVLV